MQRKVAMISKKSLRWERKTPGGRVKPSCGGIYRRDVTLAHARVWTLKISDKQATASVGLFFSSRSVVSSFCKPQSLVSPTLNAAQSSLHYRIRICAFEMMVVGQKASSRHAIVLPRHWTVGDHEDG